jgi:signal transduction histidine kinase
MKNNSIPVLNIPNILLVDDEPDNLNILGEILILEGYKVRQVSSGEQAIKVTEKEKPDLILLDIIMPDMDGYEVCHRFKQDPDLKNIPIIFISALNDTHNIIKALSAGGVDYIDKPFQAEEVLARVKIHLQLRMQSIELRELNASKDKFFSIIAHDLRSPFNSIIGFSEILLENAQVRNYDVYEEYTQIILNSARRAMDLLSNLMEWSRSQTGRINFNPESFEMANFIEEIGLLFTEVAKQKSIQIVREINESVPVYADKDMISTILRNLVSNAIKFTYFGGKITISVQDNPEELIVSISDSGVGMKKEKIDGLFHIEHNTSTKGTNNEKGTGLGLILCKEFVEKHEGRIWVESELGKGSVFSFTIPKMSLN